MYYVTPLETSHLLLDILKNMKTKNSGWKVITNLWDSFQVPTAVLLKASEM